MQQRTLTILVSVIIALSLIAIGIFYLSDPNIRKPAIISGTPTVKKDLSSFYPLGGERSETTASGTFRFTASSTRFQESVVDFSGRGFKDYLKLVRLVDAPVAGATFLGSGSSSNLYYLDANSGEINLVDFQEKVSKYISSLGQKNIYDVLWGNDGSNLLFVARAVRSDNPIFFSALTPTNIPEADRIINNSVMGRDIRAIAVAPNKKDIFYLEADSDGYVVGHTASFSFGNKKQIYTSSLAEWSLTWPNINTITFQTKAAASVPGYLYFFNPSTRETKKIIGDVPGLTTLTSPDGKMVLFSESNDVGYSSSLLDSGKNTKMAISLRALPDKCVWTKNSATIYCAVPNVVPAGTYPDDWYRGEIRFNDSLWQIDTATGNTKLLNNPSASLINEEMDAINLFLDPLEKRLFFNNKRDRSLWMLDLEHDY